MQDGVDAIDFDIVFVGVLLIVTILFCPQGLLRPLAALVERLQSSGPSRPA